MSLHRTTTIDRASRTITVHCKCLRCKKTRDLILDHHQYEKWRGGELIQRVWPEMSKNDREALQSGICAKCWGELYE